MATHDEWLKGFCTDGNRDVKILANDIYQQQGKMRKKLFTQYICNLYSNCTHCNNCKFSPEVSTKDILNPKIVTQ